MGRAGRGGVAGRASLDPSVLHRRSPARPAAGRPRAALSRTAGIRAPAGVWGDLMLLALDTSTRTVGVAVYDGQQVLSEATWISGDHHTVDLAPAVLQALARAGLQVSDLQALAVATGPGSFTGLRVGLALAKGLALAHHLALVGVPTLDALALAQPVLDMPLAAVLRAGRGRLAVAWFQNAGE